VVDKKGLWFRSVDYLTDKIYSWYMAEAKIFGILFLRHKFDIFVWIFEMLYVILQFQNIHCILLISQIYDFHLSINCEFDVIIY
jgi:hypothetical protein